jgi:phosphatidylserine decarboxylase
MVAKYSRVKSFMMIMISSMMKVKEKMMNSISFISNRGIKPLLVLIVLTLLATVFCDFLSGVFLVLTIFAVYVFRDTKRYIYENTQSVLSPVDGKIIAIDKVDDKYKIYCKVSLLDSHTVRAPFAGELKVKKYHTGLNLNPNTLKAKTLNEQIIYKFYSEDKKATLKLKLISGFFNIGIEKNEEKTLLQGDEVSFFIDGTAIISVKEDNELLVSLGDKISSGQTILYKK